MLAVPTGSYHPFQWYYNADDGRFLSQDTYSYNFKNPVELNRYVYTANNPITEVDPLGLQYLSEYAMANSESEGKGAASEPVGKSSRPKPVRLLMI